MQLIPSTAAVKNIGTDALKAGLLGGLGIAGGNIVAGPVGGAVGGILAGSVIKGTPGLVVAIIGVLPALTGLTQNIAGQFVGITGLGRGNGENLGVM